MHFITGGAYNGKAKWVKEYYQIDDRDSSEWFNFYENAVMPKSLNDAEIVVFEGVEQMILAWLKEGQSKEIRGNGRELIDSWLVWEQGKAERQLVIIGVDMTKGIVPMDAVERQWRDMTGWFYQDLVERADRVEQIWYGINKRLK